MNTVLVNHYVNFGGVVIGGDENWRIQLVTGCECWVNDIQ